MTSGLFLFRTEAIGEVLQCLTGVWVLAKATSTGPDHGHAVSYHLKGGKALITFNDDGTGDITYRAIQIETAYRGAPAWAPILDDFDGKATFRNTVNRDRENRTRNSYEQIANSVATGSRGGNPGHLRAAAAGLADQSGQAKVSCTAEPGSLSPTIEDVDELDSWKGAYLGRDIFARSGMLADRSSTGARPSPRNPLGATWPSPTLVADIWRSGLRDGA